MKKLVPFIIIASILGLAFWLLKPNRKDNGQSMTVAGQLLGTQPIGCINVPPTYKKWSDDDLKWVEVQKGFEQHFNMDVDEAKEHVGLALGFFKSINIRPTKGAVREFKSHLENWMEVSPNRHWEVTKGSLVC